MNRADFETQLKNETAEINMEHVDKVIVDSLEPFADSIKDSHETKKVNDTYNFVAIMEELGEMTTVLSQYIRGRKDKIDLLEELADTALSVRYIQLMCGINDEELKKAINVKINRQDKRRKDLSYNV